MSVNFSNPSSSITSTATQAAQAVSVDGKYSKKDAVALAKYKVKSDENNIALQEKAIHQTKARLAEARSAPLPNRHEIDSLSKELAKQTVILNQLNAQYDEDRNTLAGLTGSSD